MSAACLLWTSWARQKCKFIRAKNLNVPQEQERFGEEEESIEQNQSGSCGHGRHEAIILGGSVLSKVKKVDDETGISKKVNESWEKGKKKVVEIDAQLGISAGVRNGATATVKLVAILPTCIPFS